MSWMLLKTLIAASIVVTVSEIADRLPRVGALLLTLPVVSILTFIFIWPNERNLKAISQLAREAMVIVPLGLPFFLPLAFAFRLGISFWPSFFLGLLLASLTICLWFWFVPPLAK